MTRAPEKKRRRRGASALRSFARRGAIVCAAGLGAAAFVMLCRAAVHAPVLHIRHICVSGEGSLEDMAPVLSRAGIRIGSSIVTARPKRAAALLLRHDPWIASAAITRKLPDRIDVQVTRRTPAAVAGMDSLYLIDSRGTIFATLPEHDQRLPLITGLQREDFYAAGGNAQELLNSALLLIQHLQRHTLVSPGTSVMIDKSLGLTVSCGTRGTRVRMGFGHFEKKVSALKRIVQDLADRQLAASVIDLSGENRAYVTLGS